MNQIAGERNRIQTRQPQVTCWEPELERRQLSQNFNRALLSQVRWNNFVDKNKEKREEKKLNYHFVQKIPLVKVRVKLATTHHKLFQAVDTTIQTEIINRTV